MMLSLSNTPARHECYDWSKRTVGGIVLQSRAFAPQGN